MTFKGKTVLITGASRGIGREFAVAFAEAGASLFITYNRTAPEDTLARLSALDADVEAVRLDVADGTAAADAVSGCVKRFGTVDVLINNAGVTRDGLLMRMKDEDWNTVLDTNLKGTFNMVKAAVRIMIKKRAGKIINIGSVIGSMGNAGQANYSASKAGLSGLTKSAARELAPRNIQVNLIAPGYISTDMTEALDDGTKNAILAMIPMKKLGTPRDVANAALFLASPASDYITGQEIHVNGGMYM